MSDFTDVFSSGLIPPSSDAYSSITISTDQHLVWPYNYFGTSVILTKILDVSCASGNNIYLPSVAQVSTGESTIIRNVGSYTLRVLDFAGNSLFALPPGIAQYFWVKDTNFNSPSSWGQITYGAGTSTAAAADLAGEGLTVASGKLAVGSPMIYCTALSVVLQAADRGAILNFNQGAAGLRLLDGANYADGFYCFIKNSGTGTVDISSYTGQFIDGQAHLGLQPMESLILNYSGGEWFTVGYGRSTLYQFSQLLLDVSAGGIFTLSSAQASNKMLTFIGNPASNVIVRVPAIVAVYYLACNITTTVTVQVSTPSDTGVLLRQTYRAVVLCDGATVSAAQSAEVTTALSMLNGTEAAPALNFASKTNTGIYKYSSQGIGFSVNGVGQMYSNGGGMTFPLLTTLLGNLTFGGTARRITGDLSNATLANRLMFQNATTDTPTHVGAIPNGLVSNSSFTAYQNSDPDNTSYLQMLASGTGLKLTSGKTGTGSYKPLALNVGGIDVATWSEAAATLGNMTTSVNRDSSLAYSVSNGSAGASANSVIQVVTNAGSLYLQKASVAAGGVANIYTAGGALNIGTTDANTLNLRTNATVIATYSGAAATLGNMTASANRNSALSYNVYNTDAGALASCSYGLTSNSGDLSLAKFSTAAGAISMISSTGGGLYVGTSDSSDIALRGNNNTIATYSGAAATLGNMTASVSRNSPLAYAVSNQDAGASASASIRVSSNAGAASLSKLSTASGLAGGASLYNTGGSLWIGTTDSGQLSFVTNNIAAGYIDSTGSLLMTKPTGGIGYGAGAGGTVPQTTSKDTTVTLSKPNGLITMVGGLGAASQIAAGATRTFTLANNCIAAIASPNNPDYVVCGISAGTANAAAYTVTMNTIGVQFCTISIRNNTAVTLDEALVINFKLIKGSA